MVIAGLLTLISPWQTVESMRSALPPKARIIAQWRGTDAAFLAGNVPGKGVSAVVRINGGKTEIRFDARIYTTAETTPISSLDLEGVVAGNAVILFNTESRLISSAISFDTGAVRAGSLRFIVTGMAPGMWEIWRNGWVVDIGVPVRAGEAVLEFEERPGSYFIRRLQ
jgi:hypothetical protein